PGVTLRRDGYETKRTRHRRRPLQDVSEWRPIRIGIPFDDNDLGIEAGAKALSIERRRECLQTIDRRPTVIVIATSDDDAQVRRDHRGRVCAPISGMARGILRQVISPARVVLHRVTGGSPMLQHAHLRLVEPGGAACWTPPRLGQLVLVEDITALLAACRL